MRWEQAIQVADFEFKFACDVNDGAQVEINLKAELVEDLPETYLIHAVVRELSGVDFDLFCLSISWSVPIIDMHGLYFGGNPGEELSRLPFWWFKRQICSNTGVPYIGLINRNGENRAAFGLVDQLTETMLNAELSEA